MMALNNQMKELLDMATLTYLMAKRYEYVDPQKHMYYYQLHFQYVMQLEQQYMMMGGIGSPDQYNQYPIY
ncbi:hypothetical protein EDD68_11272 [Melghiribacillus thermohalophilus]|uniref:Coat F domain-containing protein n=2 Tax=Melghiribacillus thermohalophilus TaxID=1324956 RepID=A0A4R3MX44_9BACI|nr:hypothetical protein EDD68_11272 [Melghiribacillus thermohalophilus]